jgi:uncharacterized protein (TIGR03437 family)
LLLCVVAAAALAPIAPAATVTVTATPAAVAFTYQAGSSTLPAAQLVSVKSSSGAPAYTTAINPNTDLWLTVTPLSGNLPANLSVRANPTTLAVGIYSATITVTVSGVASPVVVAITLNVTAPPSTLTLSASTLTFSAPSGSLSQTLTLATNGAPISYTATSGSSWMTVANASGTGVGVALPGEPVALTVTVNPVTLNPQVAGYIGKITVVASGSAVTVKSQNITVNFTVNSSAPTITAIWPTTLPLNGPNQNITLYGTNFYSASQSNQTVAKIPGVIAPLATTVISSTILNAVVPATSLLAAGTLNIIAENPAPGGDSAAMLITVANTPTILGVFNSATYGVGPLSPGQLVTIWGNNLGPATPATMSIVNGFVTTSLGGVTVTIDGQAAPIIYAGADQLNVQVPYEATIGNNKQVSVTNGANPAAITTVSIALTSPGIFSADGSGGGQAAALNFSAATSTYSLNSANAPAHIGDTVLLYLTGEGDYNPSPLSPPATTNTGLVIPPSLSPLPELSPLPTVTIGGVAATVSYAGPIVGSILGLVQINAVVPTGAATGQAVAVQVTVGANNSQGNITLSIHQ